MSNICKRPPYQKGQPKRVRSRPANNAERQHWQRVIELGCMAGPEGCEGRMTIHHCLTGLGRAKDHMAVIGLCERHHLKDLGIDGKRISKREWESRYGTEEKLLERVEKLLR